MTKLTMKESQNLMLSLAFDGLSEYLQFGKPEKVENINIETPGKVTNFNIDMRISGGTQHCFFSFVPSINNTSDLWFFLEHLVIWSDLPCVYYNEQEGPEAIFYAKPNGDYMILTILEEGWYEFDLPMDETKPYNKVYNDNFSIKFHVECSRKQFIQAMYKALTMIEYPSDPDVGIEYELWDGEQKDSEIVKKYCEE